MKNIDVIIRNLQELKENWEQMEKEVAEGEEPYVPNEGEYGDDLVWSIDCHPVFKGQRPCLNETKNVKYGEKGWNENCRECTALWLMDEYE